MASGKIGILGAGTWGTALAKMLAQHGNAVTVWSAIEAEIDELSASRKHKNLPGVEIPREIIFTKSVEQACSDRDVVVFAVPSVYVRQTAERAGKFISDGQLVVDVAKGIEPDTLLTMTGVIGDVLIGGRDRKNLRLTALSGPTHAEEVALNMPTTIVAASDDMAAAELVQDIFMNERMRVYTSTDILGVELCGAMKNIIALAAGVSDGLGYGDNTKAAIITRGMAEIARLGDAMGCMRETFGGLAGIGDLIVTATSDHSRNNRAGRLLGQGVSPGEAVARIGMVVEGVNALPAAMALADRYSVEMPIARAVNAIVNEAASPSDVVKLLMTREKRGEFTD